MRNFCIILISVLSFNVAYCQSRIIGNGHSDNTSVPYYDQLSDPYPQLGNGYANDILESTYSDLKPRFHPGVIITKDGDTLGGLIKYNYSLSSYNVAYRKDSIGTDSIFPIHQVKSIITEYVYLANIPFKGKETMMPWLAVGKINLFVHTKYYNIGPSETTYVFDNDRNQFVYINSKDFKIMMRHVFFDTPDMLEKIGKKGYKFDDMIKIVREYNERFR